MILIPHLLFGAAIASKIEYAPLAIILAFLSHYLLDLIPHAEYPIENIEKKQWRKVLLDVLKVSVDFFLGTLLIFIFSNNQPIIYVCAFFAILSDGLSLLNSFFPNRILKMHSDFHRKKIHFLKYKKISIFWRIFSQMIIVAISIFFMTYKF